MGFWDNVTTGAGYGLGGGIGFAIGEAIGRLVIKIAKWLLVGSIAMCSISNFHHDSGPVGKVQQGRQVR